MFSLFLELLKVKVSRFRNLVKPAGLFSAVTESEWVNHKTQGVPNSRPLEKTYLNYR